jgi:hypothetical protein
MMKRMLIFGVMVAMTLASSASAGFLVPSWNGLDGTTHEEWNFSTNANPASPDVINNPYGTASAGIIVGMFGSGWADDLSLGTKRGLWDIGGSDGSITLDIDNRPLALDYKEIWVQVVYYGAPGMMDAPVVTIDGAQFISGETSLLEADAVISGAGWYVGASKWLIEPNPSHEQVVLTGPAANVGTAVDQIVIDTYCNVPEPATIGMLLLGGAAILRRSRR